MSNIKAEGLTAAQKTARHRQHVHKARSLKNIKYKFIPHAVAGRLAIRELPTAPFPNKKGACSAPPPPPAQAPQA